MAAGADPITLKRGIEQAVEAATEQLHKALEQRYGFNAASGRYELHAAGRCANPSKVTRTTLHAIAVSRLGDLQ